MNKFMVRDRHTGRIRRKNRVASLRMKRVSRPRLHRKLRPATRIKIHRSLIKARRTHRTKFGRRTYFRR